MGDDVVPGPLSLWSTGGSLIGRSTDGSEVVVTVRRGQRLDIRSDGVTLLDDAARSRSGSYSTRGTSPQGSRHASPSPPRGGREPPAPEPHPSRRISWIPYERSPSSKADLAVVGPNGHPTHLPEVRFETEEYLLLVRHKRVSLVYGGKRDSLILKPGVELAKDDVAAMFLLDGVHDKIVLKKNPTDPQTLDLPLAYHDVPGEGAVLFVSLKDKHYITHRDPALFNWEGPVQFQVSVTSGASLRDIYAEVEGFVPNTPRFQLYHARKPAGGKVNRGDWVLVTDLNLKRIPEGNVLFHACQAKEVGVLDPFAAAGSQEVRYVEVETTDTFERVFEKIGIALAGSSGGAKGGSQRRPKAGGGGGGAEASPLAALTPYLLREERETQSPLVISSKRLDFNSLIVADHEVVVQEKVEAEIGAVAGTPETWHSDSPLMMRASSDGSIGRSRRMRDVMPCWRSLEHQKVYQIKKAAKTVILNGASGSRKAIHVSPLSEPIADVENAFGLPAQYFSLTNDGGGKAAGRGTAAADAATPASFSLKCYPITIDISTPYNGTVSLEVHPPPKGGLEKRIAERVGLSPGEWELRPSVNAPPLDRPYEWRQFCRLSRTYKVVLRQKHIMITYGQTMVNRPICIDVGSTHAENVRLIGTVIGCNRVDEECLVLYAKKSSSGGTIRGAAASPLSPRTASARNLEVVTDVSWRSVSDGASYIVTKGTKQIGVRTEEHWPSHITAGANQVTVDVNEGDTEEEVWKAVGDAFDLSKAASLLNVDMRAFYLAVSSCDAPIRNLSHRTLRDGTELLLCLPRKKAVLYSALNAKTASPANPDLVLSVLPSDTHDTTLKALEARFGLSSRDPYRLFGPYSSGEYALSVASDLQRIKSEKLKESALSYVNLSEKKPNYFLVCPPKRIMVVHDALGIGCPPLSIGLSTLFAEVLDAITAGFSRHCQGNRPTHLLTDSGSVVDHLSYSSADPLEVYHAVWGKPVRG